MNFYTSWILKQPQQSTINNQQSTINYIGMLENIMERSSEAIISLDRSAINTHPICDTSGDDSHKAKMGRFCVCGIATASLKPSPARPVEGCNEPIQHRRSLLPASMVNGCMILEKRPSLLPSQSTRSATINHNLSSRDQRLIQQARDALLNDMRARKATSCAVKKNTRGDSIVCIAEPGQKVKQYRSAQTPLLFYVKTGSNQGQDRLGTFYKSYQLEESNDRYRINPEPRLMKVQEFRFQALSEAHNLKNQQGTLCAGISCSNVFYVDMMKLPGKSMDELDCHNWNIGKKLKFGLALLDYADSYTSYGMILPDLNLDNIRYDPVENQIHFIDSTRSGHVIGENGGSDHEHDLLFATPKALVNDKPAEKKVVYSLGRILTDLFFEPFSDIASRLNLSLNDEMTHTPLSQKNIFEGLEFKVTNGVVGYDPLFIDQYKELFSDMIAYDEKKWPEVAMCAKKFRELVTLQESRSLRDNTIIHNNDSSLKDRVLEQFYDGRALARMLFDDCFHKLTLDGTMRSKSVSLMIPNVPYSLYGDIGYIIDADKTVIRMISQSGLSTGPIDSHGEDIYFNIENGEYYLIDDSESSPYHGRVKWDVRIGEKRLSSIFQVPHAMKKYKMDFSKDGKSQISGYLIVSGSSLGCNELLVNYTKESIIGIVVVINRHYFKKHGLCNDKIKETAIEFRDYHKSDFGTTLPVCAYDTLTGQLELLKTPERMICSAV